MSKYEKLLSFIPYFENENNKFYWKLCPKNQSEGVFSLSYLEYDQKFLEFIEEFYQTDLGNTDY